MTDARRVLVVDDDTDLRESLAEVLGDEGYDTVTASNGREALDLLTKGLARPDVILLDMMMPVMDGWQLRTELERVPELASIPVIVFTAYGSAAIGRQLRAAASLDKPVQLDHLLSTVGRVVAP